MSSVNPRVSGLWSTSSRMSYVSVPDSYDEDSEDGDIEAAFGSADDLDGRTPLDRTIDRIGMGKSFSPLTPYSCCNERASAGQGATSGRSYVYAASVSDHAPSIICDAYLFLGWMADNVCRQSSTERYI